MGLEVLLRVRADEYFATSLASRGFKVLVHESFDFPGGATPSWLLAPSRTLFLSLAPKVMATTARALRQGLRTRGCVAAGELRLPHLRAYTYHNCATECRRNRSLALCGCAPAHYPRT
ncbi:Pickpocket protein 11, partial [Gryllus bimaculatus]